jgi:hypothetical protein
MEVEAFRLASPLLERLFYRSLPISMIQELRMCVDASRCRVRRHRRDIDGSLRMSSSRLRRLYVACDRSVEEDIDGMSIAPRQVCKIAEEVDGRTRRAVQQPHALTIG